MTPEKWSAVEEIYLAALERDAAARAGFLQEACGADAELRREVETLLEYQPRAEGFLESAVPSGLGEAPRTGRLTGRLLGSYDVQSLIAAGGMGEVYRAFDTRLHRAVAIKVLPEHLSEHPERRERFKREAMLISSLNHPHICSLFHVGTHEGLDYLVMEFIDGETLQARLARRPMRWAEAVRRLIEIADALDAAHRQGIVHRDLKPANVMLTKSGAKVLDFGLAARRAPLPGPIPDLALSGDTDLTVEGRLMGTVPYMPPERLQGRSTDARTDIFAFGALAYEMIAGKAPFRAESQADLIGAILKDEPEPIAASVPDVPPLLARIVARCLAKDPAERWQTAADLLFELRALDESAGVLGSGSAPRHRSRGVERTLWLAALATSLLFALSPWVRNARPVDAPPAAATRFSIPAPEGTSFVSEFDVPFTLSPDGRWLAYVAAAADGTRHLWVRAMDSEQQVLLTGTEGAASPFWSPDSEWVGFFAAGTLKKVRVTSPIVQVIASPATTMAGAAWSRNDVIVFPGPGGLRRVSANGGPISSVSRDKYLHLWPQFLDDGEHYIYSSFTPRRLLLGSLSGAPPRTLMTFPVNVSGLAYVSGFILFVQDGVLLARAFDSDRFKFTGDARQLVDGIPVTGPGRAPFTASRSGVLAFSTDPMGTPAVLRWVGRNGDVSAAIVAPAKYFGFSLSPDNRTLAFSRVGSNGGPDLWVRNIDTGSETQLTFDGVAFTPRWSPDGSRILFTGIAERPPPMLFIKDLGRTAAAQPLGRADGPRFAASWSRSHLVSVRVGGDLLAAGPGEGNDLFAQQVGDGDPQPLPINTDANESEGSLSPNAEWIAYTTDQSGRDEVWVASFPSGTLRRRVSVGGGVSPQWCGPRELVYLTGDQQLVAVSLQDSNQRIDVRDHRPLFRYSDLARVDRTLVPTANAYAATADCGRFLLATNPPDPRSPPITVIVNWPVLLER